MEANIKKWLALSKRENQCGLKYLRRFTQTKAINQISAAIADHNDEPNTAKNEAFSNIGHLAKFVFEIP